MTDKIRVADEGKKFAPHPEGQYVAVCVDLVDMGRTVKTWPGEDSYLTKEAALVFQSGELNEEGHPFEVSAKMTVSMNAKANLRAFLEAWRGKSYSEDEARKGIDLDKLVGHSALLSVEHKESKVGRAYAKVRTVAPVPKGMVLPTLPEYVRAPYWEKMIAGNAEAVAKFLKPSRAMTVNTDFSDFPEAMEDEGDGDLPF